MRPQTSLAAAAFVLLTCISVVQLGAQNPPPAPPGAAGQGGSAPAGAGGRGARGGGGGQAFPAQQRPPADPAIVARGKTLFEINCRSCHGADLRGGDMGGPNLLRSPVVLNDQDGELIVPIVQNGRQTPGLPAMPPLPIAPDDVKAIATYIHSVAATMRGQGNPPLGPPVVLNILVGNAAAGQAYFTAHCSSCHSATGDLAGLASRVSEPVQLQNLWVSGGSGRGARGRGGRGAAESNDSDSGARQVTVTVTQPNGDKLEGRLIRVDDFLVVLGLPDGSERSVSRDGDVPKVEIHNPLETHLKMLSTYTENDIHDVTAYLVTLK
jgi:cytochrome c oxidase cbb3-type subunit 3